jgi:signal transduction histidine kinase
MHSTDTAFTPAVSRLYSSPESDALEKLIRLKAELKGADIETFWLRLMEGMTDVCGAQYAFVAKRMLIEDPGCLVEMPPIGEPGSCVLGVAFYYNNGKQHKAMHRDYKILAWSNPCAHMKHDKVFLVPERMSEFILDNPNQLPFTAEGYLGVPLFYDGKCFAHFAVMWTQEGLNQRALSWPMMETILHSLEDLVVYRLINGESFVNARQQQKQQQLLQTMTPPEPLSESAVVSLQVMAATQSLKPYAKSLSHELRTPMHGVVGMLDVMHATVQEQIEGQGNPKVRQVFQTLKENIETVQDSSQRAVEAADNVVHAYDMNLQIPDTPLQDTESPATAASATTTYFDHKPSRLIEGSNISANPHKRRRSSDNWHFGTATKLRHTQSSSRREASPTGRKSPPPISPRQLPPPFSVWTPDSLIQHDSLDSAGKLSMEAEPLQTPGLRQSSIRQIIPSVIQESLRVGGRPDSATSEPTDLGELIEVRTRSSNGEVAQKTIEWSVDEDVPEILTVEERDLFKLISAVFLNAVKFTEDGQISLRAALSKTGRFLVVHCRDNGDGIPEDFQPELFKPFSREDASTTRPREGLGLGLLVAKGLARRMGGELSLLRSAISGQQKGSEFEIRIPLEPGVSTSRTGTPLSHTPEPVRPHSSTRYNSQMSSSIMNLQTRDVASPLLPTSPAKENVRNATWDSSMRRAASPGSPSRPQLTQVHAKTAPPTPRPISSSLHSDGFDRSLASKYPLTFLVAEDNKINRRLLVSMLGKLGYKDVHEAFDGREAVRIMADLVENRTTKGLVDVVLMDLWMPEMDGYAATEEILAMFKALAVSSNNHNGRRSSSTGMTPNGTDPSVNLGC